MTNHDSCHKRIAELQELLDAANATIEHQKRLLIPPHPVFPASFNLTHCESLILTILYVSDGAVTNDRLAYAIENRGIRSTMISDDALLVVKVHMSKLRRKLGFIGVNIETRYGEGYELPLEDKQRLEEAIKANAVLPRNRKQTSDQSLSQLR